MKVLLMICAVFAASVGFGYQVSLGTYVSNAGKQVTVPVMRFKRPTARRRLWFRGLLRPRRLSLSVNRSMVGRAGSMRFFRQRRQGFPLRFKAWRGSYPPRSSTGSQPIYAEVEVAGIGGIMA